jgi:hypothetical protein
MEFDRVIVKNDKYIYHLSEKKRAIFRIKFDLSEEPQLHFKNELNNKMLSMYTSNDDSYIFIVYSDETECILITNNKEALKKDSNQDYYLGKYCNILAKFELGPGVKNCGFIYRKDSKDSSHGAPLQIWSIS